MDPQSAAFTPSSAAFTSRDDWRLDMLRVQQTVVDHSERLSRLERRQDEDARMKSVWGTSSPFPGVLSGTPQQGETIIPIGLERSIKHGNISLYMGSTGRSEPE
jgi:hypothetical protein